MYFYEKIQTLGIYNILKIYFGIKFSRQQQQIENLFSASMVPLKTYEVSFEFYTYARFLSLLSKPKFPRWPTPTPSSLKRFSQTSEILDYTSFPRSWKKKLLFSNKKKREKN